MVNIPMRFLDGSGSMISPKLIQLKIDLQAKRQNYGKAKEIYSAKNKWSKIVAKPTTGMGAPLPTNCFCDGQLFYQNGQWYCQGLYGTSACPK